MEEYTTYSVTEFFDTVWPPAMCGRDEAEPILYEIVTRRLSPRGVARFRSLDPLVTESMVDCLADGTPPSVIIEFLESERKEWLDEL